MQNQFFGDINDYAKYGLLRILSGGLKGSVGVCWMLTVNTRGAGGGLIGYLRKPQSWERFDHNLFNSLREAVLIYGDRDVSRASHDDVLSPSIFYSYASEIPDELAKRQQYFEAFFEALGNRPSKPSLVFFDPDKGICTDKNPRARSVERVYLDELQCGHMKGQSVLVIQFLPFFKKAVFVKKTVREIFLRFEVQDICDFQTDRVVFFLIPRQDHLATMRTRSKRVNEIWNPKMRATWHKRETALACDDPATLAA